MPTRNLRLVIAYDGTDFSGWQRQPNAATIQGCLEAAIEKVVGERVKAWGSGRTDAGVHALNQVANFKTTCEIPSQNLLKALNDLLPSTVRIKEVAEVAEDFHARNRARAKTYRYRILQAPICPPFLARFVYHYPFPLDHRRMATAARLIEGEHDFTSFAGLSGAVTKSSLWSHQRGSMVRKLFASRMIWRPPGSILIYEVEGSGFLHHMVRNLVGTLIEVGRGKKAPEELLKILEARDRTQAGPTAPPQGLFLVKVEY